MRGKPRSLIYGVGVNDAPYSVYYVEDGKKKRCPFYHRWSNMLHRCYSGSYRAYQGCTVCEDWLIFSNFKAWMETQNWEGMDLDKDILYLENKIYSPETCIFVPHWLNGFVEHNKLTRGKYKLGVMWDTGKGKFRATSNQKFLGRFDTEEEAHQAWLYFKTSSLEERRTELDSLYPDLCNILVKRYKEGLYS